MVDVVYKKDGQNRAHRVTKDEFLSMVQDPSISFSSIDLELVLRVFSTVGEAVEFLNSGGFPWSVNGIRAGCSLGPYRTGLVNYAWDEGCAECKCSGFHYDSLEKSWRGLIDLSDVPKCVRCNGRGSVSIRQAQRMRAESAKGAQNG